MQSDDNDQQRVMLFVVLPLLALVVAAVLGLGVVRALGDSATQHTQLEVKVRRATPKPSAVERTANQAQSAKDDASVVVDGGLISFYFASASADLAAGAVVALADAATAAKAGRYVVLSGFHDETGDAAFNADLAKRRAMVVREALLMAGAPEDRVVMSKPEVLTGSGSNAQARRVEVSISDKPAM